MGRSIPAGHHPAHHSAHHPPRHKAPPRRSLPWTPLAVAALAVAALAGWALWPQEADSPAPTARLVEQMRAAATGNLAERHVFGGTLSLAQGNGRVNVTAEDLPSKACVQAGWLLAKEGTIIVNGTLPMRLSAARLAELCGGDGARLTWVPHEGAPAEGRR